MSQRLPVYNLDASKIASSEVELGTAPEISETLFSQALRVEFSNFSKKAGRTLKKGEVSGGGRKPWRQKGTGKARAGSIRSPLFRGGGITFGPTGEKRVLKLPRKSASKVFLGLMLALARQDRLTVLETLEIKDGKTKTADAIIAKFLPKTKLVLIHSKADGNIKPWRNHPLINPIKAETLNLLDLLGKKTFFVSKSTLISLIEKNAEH